jgi:hypothetical protein
VKRIIDQQVKQTLILYRPGTADGDDPDVAQALALVKKDQKLSRWFANNCVICEALREKFRQIPVPLDSLQELKARLARK